MIEEQTMLALVVYESMYGDTRAVAEQVRAGLAPTLTTDLVEVGQPVPHQLDDYTLIVLGGPTHAFGMSTPASRTEAHAKAGTATAAGTGVREWLANLGDYHGEVAAFDTRMGPRAAPGTASRAIARRLRRSGHKPPGRRSFKVEGVMGPVADGELDLARAWGAELASQARGPLRGGYRSQ